MNKAILALTTVGLLAINLEAQNALSISVSSASTVIT
jgi:hypothetical protein